MRKLIIAASLIILGCATVAFVGCTGKSSADNESDSLSVDTLEGDAMDQIVSSTPITEAIDELFDDFLFVFAGHHKLQRERIVFPLPVNGDKKVKQIEQKDWQIDRFFMRQDSYTLFFNDEKAMDAMTNAEVSHAVLERIYLDKGIVKQYIFDRLNGKWMLTSINNTTLEGTSNASFLSFYKQFVSDEEFQMKSINDPLDFSGPDPDDEIGTLEGLLMPEQWPSFAPPLPKGMIYNIVYGNPAKEGNKKIFLIRGIANGMETQLVFERKGGKWYLTKLTM